MVQFDQNIKQPSHDFIRFSDDTVARVLSDRSGIEIEQLRGNALLDENDAIRLAAFLNRWFRERHVAEILAEANRSKASREAKQKRYEERRVEVDG